VAEGYGKVSGKYLMSSDAIKDSLDQELRMVQEECYVKISYEER